MHFLFWKICFTKSMEWLDYCEKKEFKNYKKHSRRIQLSPGGSIHSNGTTEMVTLRRRNGMPITGRNEEGPLINHIYCYPITY